MYKHEYRLIGGKGWHSYTSRAFRYILRIDHDLQHSGRSGSNGNCHMLSNVCIEPPGTLGLLMTLILQRLKSTAGYHTCEPFCQIAHDLINHEQPLPVQIHISAILYSFENDA